MGPVALVKRMGGLFVRTRSLSLTCKFFGLGLQGRALSKSYEAAPCVEKLLGLKKDTLRDMILELAEDRPFLQYVNRKVEMAAEDIRRRGMKGTVGVFNYGPLLYALIRVFKPSVMIETGVASGTSSACVLKAMQVNGKGRLISIDLPAGDTVNSEYTAFQWNRKGSFGPTLVTEDFSTGYAVQDTLKDRWKLVLGDAKVELPRLLKEAGPVDVFMHDSEHSYEHMTFEFESVYPFLTPGGLVLSDDVSWNDSFKDFANRVGKPYGLEPIGVLRK